MRNPLVHGGASHGHPCALPAQRGSADESATDKETESGLLGRGLAEPIGHVSADVAQLADRDVLEAFAAAIEGLVDLYRGLLHVRMGLSAAAEEHEVLAPGQTHVSVAAIQTQTQQRCRSWRAIGSHTSYPITEKMETRLEPQGGLARGADCGAGVSLARRAGASPRISQRLPCI